MMRKEKKKGQNFGLHHSGAKKRKKNVDKNESFHAFSASGFAKKMWLNGYCIDWYICLYTCAYTRQMYIQISL